MTIRSKGQKTFNIFNVIIMILLALCFIVPYLLVVSASFTSNASLQKDGYSLFPKEFSLEGYKFIFSMNGMFVRSIFNSIFIAGVSTIGTLVVCVLCAYPISKKYLVGCKWLNIFFVFTMLFSGGLLPTFIIVKSIGLYNTHWALIIPLLVNAWNILLIRNYFYGIPDSIEESAKMDGANDFTILLKIYVPLSKSILATIAIFTAVEQWNNWFGPMIYISSNNKELYPIQYLVKQMIDDMQGLVGDSLGSLVTLPTITARNAGIVIATLPIIILYPFMQKYFINGIVLGSVKG